VGEGGVRFLLPPVSEGEDSITEEEGFEPTFKWIANTIIDSSFLETNKIEPKKVERGRVAPEWKGVVELLLFNVDRKIHIKSEVQLLEDGLKLRFEKFPWIKLKRVKEVYYKGRPSIILRFQDETAASFAYFNLATSQQKEAIGNACEIYRITENKLREKLTSDVCLVFRKLPLSMTKESFLGIFKKVVPSWMEEFVEIGGFKYTICKVPYMDEAFQIVAAFQAKGIKEAKVNYHPKSSKAWRPVVEQTYFEGL
jgi:hypothetical protein